MPLKKNIHVDAVLTNLSRAVKNTELVALEIWPVAKVKKDSDVYYEFDLSNLRPEETEWAPKTIAKEVNWESSTTPYKVERHGLQQLIEDDELQNADTPIKPMSDSTEIITEKMMVRREIRLATILQAVGTYPAGHSVTLAAPAKWDVFSTSNPNTDMSTARSTIFSKIAHRPNIMVIPRNVYEIVREHPLLLDRIKHTETGVLTPELLAVLFDVDRVVIAGGLQNTGNEGQADSLAFIYGKNIFVGWVNPRPALKQPSWGYHLESKPFTTVRWRDEEREGEVVRVSYKDVPKTIADTAGYIIRDVIS